MKKDSQYVRGLMSHWRERRTWTGKGRPPVRKGGVNACWRPSNEVSKADLREDHAENMKLKGRKRRSVKPDVPYASRFTVFGKFTKPNHDPVWRNRDQRVGA